MKRQILSTDLMRKNFTNSLLTFSVEHIRCDNMAMVMPVVVVYTSGKSYLDIFGTNWWVVGNMYQKNSFTFYIPKDTLDNTAYYRVGLMIDGLSPTNRLYFNHIQLSEGTVNDYHQPESSIPKSDIKFTTDFSANLYTSDDSGYLQVIRPYYNNIDTETIKMSKATILAPHLADEDEVDSPANIGLEYMNSTDQVIEILR